jgi:hypothetical protein
MAKIPDTFNFGETEDMSIEELVIKLQRMYQDLAEACNSKPDLYQRTTDGQAGDTFLANGSINLNLNTNKVEMLTNHISPAAVTWTQLS